MQLGLWVIMLTRRPDSKFHPSEIFISKFKVLTVVFLGDSGVVGCDGVLLGERFPLSDHTIIIIVLNCLTLEGLRHYVPLKRCKMLALQRGMASQKILNTNCYCLKF